MNPKILLTVPLLLLCSAASAENDFHMNNEFSLNYNKVSGPGKSASSLTENLNYLEVLNLNGGGRKSGWDYNYNLGLKATDDERNDIKTVLLTNLNGVFRKNANTVSLGDIFESFSQYTLATSLKGASYKYAKNGGRAPEITALFGYAYPRWDSVWKEPLTRTVARRAYGARAKENFSDSLSAGLSYINVKDTGRVNAADALYDSYNLALDLNYNPFPGLTVAGEHSLSDYDENAAGVSAKGSATRIELVGDADPSRVSLEYEEVQPDFFSALGAAVSDRRKVKTKWRYKYSRHTTFNSGLLWYRNNLPGSSAADTTQSWRPELGMAVKKIFSARPYSFADFSYKFDRKFGSGSSRADHHLNVNYRDRFAGLDSDSNLGYTLYKTEADVRDASEINFNTSLNSRQEKGNWVLKPQLNLGTWYSDDELTGYTDKIYEYSLGLGAELPGKNITSDLRLGQNVLKKEDAASDDSSRFFASLGAYWRTKIMKYDSTVFLRAGYNGFDFSTSSRNFREKTVTLGVNTQF